jgi:hypothetical protein
MLRVKLPRNNVDIETKQFIPTLTRCFYVNKQYQIAPQFMMLNATAIVKLTRLLQIENNNTIYRSIDQSRKPSCLLKYMIEV